MKGRDGLVKVRVSAEEKAEWQRMAKDEEMTVSDFVRTKMGYANTVDRPPKKTRTGRKADPLLLSNIGRVGSNLNQLARWANTYKNAAEASEILLALVAIEQQLRSVTPSTNRKNKRDADAEGEGSSHAE